MKMYATLDQKTAKYLKRQLHGLWREIFFYGQPYNHHFILKVTTKIITKFGRDLELPRILFIFAFCSSQ